MTRGNTKFAQGEKEAVYVEYISPLGLMRILKRICKHEALTSWANNNKTIYQLSSQREFQSQTSDNMERWKTEKKKQSREKEKESEERRHRRAKCKESRETSRFSNDLWVARVEK